MVGDAVDALPESAVWAAQAFTDQVAVRLQLPQASAYRVPAIGTATKDDALNAWTTLRDCTSPLDALTAASTAAPVQLADDPALTHRHTEATARTPTVRRTIGRRPQPPAPEPASGNLFPAAPDASTQTALDGHLDTLLACYTPPSPQEPPTATR
ncbi:hypothetical protein [Streptomyces sp. MH60]|uniref:hypothetical protein n=1 Tax=Streptomyces sp. MH60 TaxID=1940758 RepID=UPI000D3F3840|nr:hypothetical protein [Streptomyces sp. MH60]PPS91053.1 hypothetical protein BZZ08_00652 [Streptomyces sp. MH60]